MQQAGISAMPHLARGASSLIRDATSKEMLLLADGCCRALDTSAVELALGGGGRSLPLRLGGQRKVGSSGDSRAMSQGTCLLADVGVLVFF